MMPVRPKSTWQQRVDAEGAAIVECGAPSVTALDAN